MFTLKDDMKSILYTLENIELENGNYNDIQHEIMSNVELLIHIYTYIHTYINIYKYAFT
jgi:hypothetical protein